MRIPCQITRVKHFNRIFLFESQFECLALVRRFTKFLGCAKFYKFLEVIGLNNFCFFNFFYVIEIFYRKEKQKKLIKAFHHHQNQKHLKIFEHNLLQIPFHQGKTLTRKVLIP